MSKSLNPTHGATGTMLVVELSAKDLAELIGRVADAPAARIALELEPGTTDQANLKVAPGYAGSWSPTLAIVPVRVVPLWDEQVAPGSDDE